MLANLEVLGKRKQDMLSFLLLSKIESRCKFDRKEHDIPAMPNDWANTTKDLEEDPDFDSAKWEVRLPRLLIVLILTY